MSILVQNINARQLEVVYIDDHTATLAIASVSITHDHLRDVLLCYRGKGVFCHHVNEDCTTDAFVCAFTRMFSLFLVVILVRIR